MEVNNNHRHYYITFKPYDRCEKYPVDLTLPCQYHIGDVVKVVDCGHSYSAYYKMFQRLGGENLGLTNARVRMGHDGQPYLVLNKQHSYVTEEQSIRENRWRVVDMMLHPDMKTVVYLVVNPIYKEGLLIGGKGLEPLHLTKEETPKEKEFYICT